MFVQMPRLDASTPEGKLKQIEEFLYQFITQYNNTISQLEHELEELREGK